MGESSLGLAAWERQSQGMKSAHQHLDLELNYVLSGTMRYLVGGRIVTLPPLRLCLLWGGVPHQMLPALEPVDALWVTIPLTTVLRWSLPETLTRPLLARGFIVDPLPRSTDLEQLRQWVDDLKTPTLGEIVQLELEARLRRLARGFVEPFAEHPVAPQSEGALAAVEAMAHFISQNFQDSLGVAVIAAPAHLHPNYAMTLFRRHTGLTISQYLTLQRIAHAQRLLLTTDTPLAQIALESGFRSLSRFYEAFREQTGSSPRRFRLRLELAKKEPM